MPLISVRAKEADRFQRSQARAAGSLVSKISDPPGRRRRRIERSVDNQSSSSSNTCATLPVIVTASTVVSASDSTVPRCHPTRPAPDFRCATASDAAAGSTPVTSNPASANLTASVTVPQPMSSTDVAAVDSISAT